MKAMISQPMNGVMGDKIFESRAKAKKYLKENGYDFIDTLFHNRWHPCKMIPKLSIENYPLFQLARSLEQMSKCDAVYFCKDWENTEVARLNTKRQKLMALLFCMKNN